MIRAKTLNLASLKDTCKYTAIYTCFDLPTLTSLIQQNLLYGVTIFIIYNKQFHCQNPLMNDDHFVSLHCRFKHHSWAPDTRVRSLSAYPPPGHQSWNDRGSETWSPATRESRALPTIWERKQEISQWRRVLIQSKKSERLIQYISS